MNILKLVICFCFYLNLSIHCVSFQTVNCISNACFNTFKRRKIPWSNAKTKEIIANLFYCANLFFMFKTLEREGFIWKVLILSKRFSHWRADIVLSVAGSWYIEHWDVKSGIQYVPPGDSLSWPDPERGNYPVRGCNWRSRSANRVGSRDTRR